ncbi:hypothetical protein [Novosphingobium ovatum]|uniref:hypothetical protein n=1 Tax=Novosphingobium ovatum TaxID=1908523 RepID=UPI00191C540F|nr:hypothetical protein [Novosphingobium ovatum]
MKKTSCASPPAPHGKSAWAKAFLAELAATSNVSAAARKAKVSTALVYEARRCDPAFAQAWRGALCEGYDHLEMELLRRLRAGEIKPAAGTKRSARAYDNATAFRLLSAHRETVASERAARDDMDEDAILASINAKLERMRQRSLAGKALDDEDEDERPHDA